MSTRPFAEKKFAEINGVRMAYIDEGEGDPIVRMLRHESALATSESSPTHEEKKR